MKIVFAPGARADIIEARAWWSANRPDARGLMSTELASAFDDLPGIVEALPVFRRVGRLHVKRYHVPRVHRHVYFIVVDEDVVVLAVWGAVRRLMPRLRERARSPAVIERTRVAFTAIEVGFEEDGDAIVCGVADGKPNGEHLTFQRAPPDSSDDEGIYLEYVDQAYSGYSCVRACRVTRAAMHVDLSRQLGALDEVTGFDIELHLGDRGLRELKRGLSLVFRDADAERLIVGE